MTPPDTAAGRAAEAIRQRLGTAAPDIYLGPEGDYLCLVRRSPPCANISVSCCGLPEGQYSVQVCLNGDPLDIAYDDVCGLTELLDVCEQFLDANAND